MALAVSGVNLWKTPEVS